MTPLRVGDKVVVSRAGPYKTVIGYWTDVDGQGVVALRGSHPTNDNIRYHDTLHHVEDVSKPTLECRV